jgi:hypothetical protein
MSARCGLSIFLLELEVEIPVFTPASFLERFGDPP